MALFSGRRNHKNIAVFDLGTSSVNGFWVRAFKDGSAEIAASTRAELKMLENPDFRNMWRYLKDALLLAVSNLKKNVRPREIDFVFVVFSSPWYLSQTRIVQMKRPRKFVIAKKLLEDLVFEEIEIFKKKSQEKFSLPAAELEVLEHDIMKVVLNGYEVKDPIKKEARELVVALYASIFRKETLEEFRDIFEYEFGRAPVKITSSPLALFNVLKDAVSPEEGFVLADVGGEITEISLIRHHIIEEVVTFARGGHFVVRRLASGLGVGLEDAFSFIRSKTRSELKGSLDERVSAILNDAGKAWYELFFQALSEIGKDNPLPQTLILLGGASGIEALKKESESPELARFTILGRPFSVLTLLPEAFTEKISSSGIDRKDPQMTLPLLLVLGAVKNAWQ